MLADLLGRAGDEPDDRFGTPPPAALVWAVHRPFWNYVEEVGGHVVISPPAHGDDAGAVFPYAETRTVQRTRSLCFSGEIVFTAHGGALNLSFAAPRIDQTGAEVWLSAVSGQGEHSRRLPVAALRIGPHGHDEVDAVLTAPAAELFGGQYRAGMPLSAPSLRARS